MNGEVRAFKFDRLVYFYRMLHYISADWIFPVSSAPLKNGVVVLRADGTIEKLLSTKEASRLMPGTVQELEGAIVPGFVNTHCHLELSHLKDQVPKRTGLMGFVKKIIQLRSEFSQDEIEQAMVAADKEMFTNGIVAVADISNTVSSRTTKQNSRLFYHTFVEILGFDPTQAEAIWKNAVLTKEGFNPLPSSWVPHAPYTVSASLFQRLSDANETLSSIHNQETTAENRFFEHGTGEVAELYKSLKLDTSYFSATGKSSLQSYLPAMKAKRLLLVHNTFTDQSDIDFAKRQNVDLFWCLCPNANIYIENCLPDVKLLADSGLTITLGTDSLASNGQLNILDEMKTLQAYKKVDFELLIKWATWNGADFLGKTDEFGSLEAGKKPGLNLVAIDNKFKITSSKLNRLV